MPPLYIKDGKKRCNGPLHKGVYAPLDEFWYHKSGKRAGKPFSMCKSCISVVKGRNYKRGMVPWERVKFVFDELSFRLGKMEALRRVGVSSNYITRRDKEGLKTVRLEIAARAMQELKKCRESNEVRHRKSIRYGASIRGSEEREIRRDRDYYNRTSEKKFVAVERELERTSLTG